MDKPKCDIESKYDILRCSLTSISLLRLAGRRMVAARRVPPAAPPVLPYAQPVQRSREEKRGIMKKREIERGRESEIENYREIDEDDLRDFWEF